MKTRSRRRKAVEKPLRGKVQKTDFSTSLGNPHSLGCYWDMNGSLSDDNDRKTHNSTSPEINLLQPKNGLDFGVHFTHPVQKQLINIPNTYHGLQWDPSGSRFYVAGGIDDRIEIY